MSKDVTFCPAGKKGPGGECDCIDAAGLAEGEWSYPLCDNGECIAAQKSDMCDDKEVADNGDGTVCWSNIRYTYCITTPGTSSL